MRFIELFAGIGGFRYGLESVGRTEQEISKRQSNNRDIVWGRNEKKKQGIFTCVYANEWDKYACQIYRKNFGDKELIEGDITKISTESIPDHNLLTGGFPCQSFSIAGKRKGFGDTRGTLFFEICQIVEEKKPNLLLLENVKGLLNHDGGNTFRIILDSLSELGYDCEWEVLNSKNFGVPQNRERVFIIGHLRGTGGGKVFPIGETGKENIIRTEEDIYVIHDKRSCGETRIYKNKSPAVTSTWGMGGGNVPYTSHQQDFVHNQNGILRTLPGGCHGNAQHYTKTLINNRIRRLTPTECERLQGFPDGWTEGISNTQRYKCLGNAVTTNVITEIGKKILGRKK